MTLLIDASALVAIVRNEPECEQLIAAVEQESGSRLTTGIALWEAARAVARGSDGDDEIGLFEVQRYCAAFAITVVPIGAPEATGAVRAHTLYGKGNHPARLNMGDCFAYACAKANGAGLLYKGDDFARTDLA